ncbi:hypothetical protein A2U01_0101868, partial [Trifolium medium]|nr:hypothetical protein [Trifolium medium]
MVRCAGLRTTAG